MPGLTFYNGTFVAMDIRSLMSDLRTIDVDQNSPDALRRMRDVLQKTLETQLKIAEALGDVKDRLPR